MTFTFTIPVWVLWVVGVPLGIAILFFAIVGIAMVWSFRKGLY